MTVDRYLRMIDDAFVLPSIAPRSVIRPGLFVFNAFVGLNLFQSAFTGWRPMTVLPLHVHTSCVHEAQRQGARL